MYDVSKKSSVKKYYNVGQRPCLRFNIPDERKIHSNPKCVVTVWLCCSARVKYLWEIYCTDNVISLSICLFVIVLLISIVQWYKSLQSGDSSWSPFRGKVNRAFSLSSSLFPLVFLPDHSSFHCKSSGCQPFPSSSSPSSYSSPFTRFDWWTHLILRWPQLEVFVPIHQLGKPAVGSPLPIVCCNE